MLASPVTAQRDKFGHIECTGLTVVDADGVPMIVLRTRDSTINSQNRKNKHGVDVFGSKYIAVITTYGRDGETLV